MLHIHNGDSSAGTAKKAAIPGKHLAWREALVCGPAPGGLSEDEFRRERVAHLVEPYGVNREECEEELREQEAALARFSDHEEVVLWFEHDLFCQVALAKHLQRFPSVRNGLGRVANVGLELIADGRHEFKSLFAAFGERESSYGFGDAQVFLELKRLANAAKPLLTMTDSDNTKDSGQLLKTSFQITDQGKAVLNGDEDFIRTNGIDLWLGGVHLQVDEVAWRWDESQSKLVKAL